jgi:hypothetical protein
MHRPNATSKGVKKLGYFVGKWKVEGIIFPGPWGKGGEFSWTDTTKWMSGKFFVVGHWDFKMPRQLGGNGEEVFVMGYDANEERYTFNAFSSHGLHQVSTGAHNGDTWTWDSEGTRAGRRSLQKMTMKVISRKRYTLKFEISNDAKTWTTFMEGVAVKLRRA